MTEEQTLYDTLGVARDASTKEVRAAYRAQAKLHHPDAGGDQEAFARLKEAHDVLVDQAHRAYYDATGKTRKMEADNLRGEAILRFKMVVKNAVMTAIGTGRDPFQLDILEKAKHDLHSHINDVKKQVADFEKKRGVAIKLVSRFKFDGDENIIARLFAEDVSTFESHIENCQKEIAMSKAALALFEGYSFEKDTKDILQGQMMFIPAGYQPFIQPGTTNG